ncbi:MAG: hypothetical protein Q9167_003491 [Letrouitia subvulpina]
MNEQLKLADSQLDKQAVQEVAGAETAEIDDDDAGENEMTSSDPTASGAAKKKKSKRSRLKKALGTTKDDEDPEKSEKSPNPASKLTTDMVEQLLEMNPSLKNEVAGMDRERAAESLKKLDVADLLTGMAEEGPIRNVDPDKVPRDPQQLLEGFEWVTMDATNDRELEEIYELLSFHYVEDEEAMFRFNYSVSFLNWALKSPGWRKEWHVGVRASKSRKLVAFISGVPQALRVRSNTLRSVEVNFLCIHKKLRSKRLAPVLIQEITRRIHLQGIFHAIYTAGIVLPKPVSSCRYFHRSLDWLKLYEVGFSPLPEKSTKARQVTKYHLPSNTSTKGVRPMQRQDVPAVQSLLGRYLKRFVLAPELTEDEVEYWLYHDERSTAEQVIWSYVVEDPESHKITDFFSFYCLESSVINSPKHDNVRAAYMFYYATETAFADKEKGLKERLNGLMTDALILAKRFNFDVFNALTLLDNPLFLEQLKFGPGDGQLHYYLYNYRTLPIAGGVDAKNSVDDQRRGGIGVVML